METWSFSQDTLNDIEYQYDINNITNLTYGLCDWINYKTHRISIIKAKTTETNEDVIAVYIYYAKKNPYGRAGSHNSCKVYHLYNGKVYGRQGMIKTVPKEVKLSLKEIGIEV